MFSLPRDSCVVLKYFKSLRGRAGGGGYGEGRGEGALSTNALDLQVRLLIASYSSQ